MRKIAKFFCAVIFIADTHTISQQHISEISFGFAAIAAIVPPLEIAYLNACQFRRSFLTEIQDPRYVLSGLALGTVVGSLIYYVGKQFTPQSRYEWALSVKDSLESDQLLHVLEHNRIKMKELLAARFGQYPFISLIDFFYYKHCTLQRALEGLCAAILELEEDDVLSKQCKVLVNQINRLDEMLKENAATIVCTGPDWYRELDPHQTGAFFISRESRKSITWVIELTGGNVNGPLITFGRELQRLFSKHYKN